MSADSLHSVYEFFDLSSDGIALVAPDPWRVVFCNLNLTEWAGDSPVDRPIEDLLGELTPKQLHDRLELAWGGDTAEIYVHAQLVQQDPAQRDVPVEVRFRRVEIGQQPLVGVNVRKLDVKSKAASRRDPLTGLSDRTELLSRLDTLLASERPVDQRFAVLFIDLDHFKSVNDQYGHLIGDRVLSEVSHRLVASVRAGDRVFRYGGDEFVVLVEQVNGEYDCEPVVGRIHAELAQPIVVRSEEVHLAASIGVAEVSAAHRTPEDLIAEADLAMYAAKRKSLAHVRR